MAIRAFLSFVQEDINLVNLFRAQSKLLDSELEFHDYSIKVPFDSHNVDYIGRGIAEQIKLSTLAVCLYGPTTYSSKWVDWELRKALALDKPIMGVCLYSDSRVKHYPASLEGWPLVNWDISAIVTTMARLTEQYRRSR